MPCIITQEEGPTNTFNVCIGLSLHIRNIVARILLTPCTCLIHISHIPITHNLCHVLMAYTHRSHVCAYTLCTPHIHPFTCGLTDLEDRVSIGIKIEKSLQGTL